MYNRAYQHPYYSNCHRYNPPIYNPYFMNEYVFPYMPTITKINDYIVHTQNNRVLELTDYGPNPFVINIDEATEQNNNFRTALWTGDNLQLTLMSIPVGEEIGLEMHPDTDQFIRIEDGRGLVLMGDTEDNLDFQEMVYDDFIFIIPAGKWHNLINMGNEPLKLYSVYAPPNHPHGTVHETKAIAEQEETL
nr:cupin domain-containing protein [Sedimentibacter hydroxybenzoicus]